MSKKCKSGKLRQKQRKQAFIAAGKTHGNGPCQSISQHTNGAFGMPTNKQKCRFRTVKMR